METSILNKFLSHIISDKLVFCFWDRARFNLKNFITDFHTERRHHLKQLDSNNSIHLLTYQA
jgi:hypothetical protein